MRKAGSPQALGRKIIRAAVNARRVHSVVTEEEFEAAHQLVTSPETTALHLLIADR